MLQRFLLLLIFCLSPQSTTVLSLRVANETVPPGGVVQVKVTPTEPKPISGSRTAFLINSGVFSQVLGVALFSPADDVGGTAVLKGNVLTVRAISALASLGTDTQVPLLAIALAVRPDAVPGTQTTLGLDLAASQWIDPLGQPYTAEIQPGVLTVGGKLSVSNIVPGGGRQPAGTIVRVEGLGFEPATIVRVNGPKIAATQFVSPSEIRLTLGQEDDLHGRRFQVINPDGSQTVYFSYLRAANLTGTTQPLLAKTMPVFGQESETRAVLVLPSAPVDNPNVFTAIAIQNPNLGPVSATIEALSPDGAVVKAVTVSLPGTTRASWTIQELLGLVNIGSGIRLRMTATARVQLLGLVGDEATGVVVPLLPVQQ